MWSRVLLVLAIVASPGLASAQDVEEVEQVEITVARALFEQGLKLYHQGRYADALQLFREAHAKNPGGPYADSARQMVTRCEDKLGLPHTFQEGEPEDPYGADDPAPEDPYGADDPTPEDPYANGNGDTFELEPEPENPYGEVPRVRADDKGDRSPRLVLMGSGVFWGATYGILISSIGDDPEDPDDKTDGDYFGAALLTGLIGGGVGYWLDTRHPSQGDVALVNSVGGYGLGAALMLGVLMDPAQGRAYSLNGFIGATVGLGAGFYLAGQHDVSRKRMGYIDLGVGAGLATPWVLFALLGGDSDSAQFTGAMSCIGMGVGGYLAWKWTKGMDVKPADDLAFGVHPLGDGGWALDLSGSF